MDRLGVRLTAASSIAEADLECLAAVVDAYQEVLDDVKARLTDVGYAATTRVKTTGTLVDKLRRETARLSQVQDLAGARIVLADRMAQDAAVDMIRGIFESTGSTCKTFDRRENPSHGYRAVHLVVQVDRVPVEIQIRTDLQDTWAQIVERLADRWGRGIRYGGDPEDPDAQAGALKVSRRDVLAVLAQLSELIARLEMSQVRIRETSSTLHELESIADTLVQAGGTENWVIEEEVPPDLLDRMTRVLANRPDNDVSAVLAGWRRMTAAEFAEALRGGCALARQENERQGAEVRSVDGELRVILRRFADATGQG